jgi:hypothetical protein
MTDQTLPPYLMTSDPDSFARHTILERKPQIIRQVITNNAYPPEVAVALDDLRKEIASLPMQPLHESVADVAFWNAEVSNYTGKTWLEVPWYFAETYFYRKLLETVGYFQPGERHGRDPFEKQKRAQIDSDIQKLAVEWEQLSALEPETRFVALLHSCLWGNRADLSNFTVTEKGRGGLTVHEERHLILIDHTEDIQKLLSNGVSRVDFICDNVGSDLLFDLGLTDFLLNQGWVKEIQLNLKNQPFFVSDAMPADVLLTITGLKNAPDAAMRDWGRRLERNLAAGRLILETDQFWTTCLMFRQMPAHLRQGLAHSAAVLIKGDVNYRRLLDDRAWPHTTRMEDVCSYFPAPFVTLRTLKGEIMVGLEAGQAEALQAKDSTWLINGKRGIIQLVIP